MVLDSSAVQKHDLTAEHLQDDCMCSGQRRGWRASIPLGRWQSVEAGRQRHLQLRRRRDALVQGRLVQHGIQGRRVQPHVRRAAHRPEHQPRRRVQHAERLQGENLKRTLRGGTSGGEHQWTFRGDNCLVLHELRNACEDQCSVQRFCIGAGCFSQLPTAWVYTGELGSDATGTNTSTHDRQNRTKMPMTMPRSFHVNI